MVRKRIKPFDIRKNDRDYKEGDILVLRYFNRKIGLYKFETLVAKVLSVFQKKGYGIEHGYCVMGIELLLDFSFAEIDKTNDYPAILPFSPIGKLIKFGYDGFGESHIIDHFEIEEKTNYQRVYVKNPIGDIYWVSNISIYANDESQLFKLNEQLFK